jgi:coproporphyrinogen III oxidase
MEKNKITSWLMSLQDRICNELELLDGSKFHEDIWERQGGGGGRTRIIQGTHIEKGGVNFSAVHGELSPQSAKAIGIEDDRFFASGISIVLHPKNPMVPIIHMNVRYFETNDRTWWFGGGIDVTPHYIDISDAREFHRLLKSVCDAHNPEYYDKYKRWADDYFYIKHRQETRGIGGIFFDKLTEPNVTKEQGFAFLQDVGNSFIPAYKKLFFANFQKPYTDKQKDWQLLRRGRYVEFNLVWDRGTKFGLETDGRTESILMSLPTDARWIYGYKVDKDSAEQLTLALLKKGLNWVDDLQV